MTDVLKLPEPFSELPPAEALIPAEVAPHTLESAVRYASDIIADFSYNHTNGLVLGGKLVTTGSLTTGVEAVVRSIEEDPDNTALDGTLFRLFADLSEERRRNNPSIIDVHSDPLVLHLVSRGAFVERPTNTARFVETGTVAENDKPSLPSVLVDGQTVRGKIVPGVGVQTAHGVVRSHSTGRFI